MLRKFAALAGAILVCGLIVADVATASVPKVVIAEDFTATWCTYCPAANCALQTMETEFGDQFIFWENHCSSSDPFTTAETTAREHWYSVPGYPTVVIDGKYQVIGAGSCES